MSFLSLIRSVYRLSSDTRCSISPTTSLRPQSEDLEIPSRPMTLRPCPSTVIRRNRKGAVRTMLNGGAGAGVKRRVSKLGQGKPPGKDPDPTAREPPAPQLTSIRVEKRFMAASIPGDWLRYACGLSVLDIQHGRPKYHVAKARQLAVLPAVHIHLGQNRRTWHVVKSAAQPSHRSSLVPCSESPSDFLHPSLSTSSDFPVSSVRVTVIVTSAHTNRWNVPRSSPLGDKSLCCVHYATYRQADSYLNQWTFCQWWGQ